MGQNNNNDKKPLLERLSQALDSLETTCVLVNELNNTASLNDGLKPSERAVFNDLKRRLQDAALNAGIETPNVISEQQPATLLNAVDPATPAYTNNTRRKSSKSFDALMLMGVKYSAIEGKTVSQARLFELGQAYDPQTKKASLIAKLNRWKSDAEFLKWSKPEMITLTERGEQEVKDLEEIAATAGDLNQLRATIEKTFGFTPVG